MSASLSNITKFIQQCLLSYVNRSWIKSFAGTTARKNYEMQKQIDEIKRL